MSDAPHIYVFPGTDTLVPSVTTMLRIIAKPELESWRITQAVILARQQKEASFEEVAELINKGRNYRGEIGSGVHECIAAYHKGQEFPDSYKFQPIHDLVYIYTTWAAAHMGAEVLKIEELAFGSVDDLPFAGTPDIVMATLKAGTTVSIDGVRHKLDEDITALLDFKTGSSNQPEWQLQLTGYNELATQYWGLTPERVATVRINPDGVHVKIWDLDQDAFAAAVRLWYWRFGPAELERIMKNGE